MAEDNVQASGLGVELTGLLDFLNRLPRDVLTTDAEAARKHYVELLKELHASDAQRPPQLPPRTVAVQIGYTMRTKSVPDCRVDDSSDLDFGARASRPLSQHSILTDITSGDESLTIPTIGESSNQVSVYWSGHLNQGSKKDGSIRMSWNRRWCVVRDDRLYCYKTASDPMPVNEYSLHGSQVLQTTDGEVDKAHSFKVIQQGMRESDILYFAVFVADDMSSCMQAFTAAAAGVRHSVEYQPRIKSTSFPALMSDDLYQRPRPLLNKPIMRPLSQRGRSSTAISTSLSFTSGPISMTSGPLSATSDTSGQQGLDEGTGSYEALDEAESQANELERKRKNEEVAETSKLPKRKLVKTRPSSSEHESVYEELDFSVGEEEPMANGHGSPEEYPGTTASSSDANEARFVRETRKGGVRGSGRRLKEMLYGKLRSSKRSHSELKHSAAEQSATELVDDSAMSGFLMKKDSSGYTWRRRWCVVKGICFYYFRSEEHAKPQLAVVLRGWTINSFDGDPKHQFAFQISHDGILPYCFATDGSEAKEDWIKAITAAISLEAADSQSSPSTPARSSGASSKGRHFGSSNDLEGQQLLKAVQSLGNNVLSPTDQPPPLPDRSSTANSLYDELGPPRPLPTAIELRTLSPRMSLSSMANENDLYNVPKKDGAAIEESDAGEGIYNVPRLTTSLERPRPNASGLSGSDDEEDHYEPLDVQPLAGKEEDDMNTEEGGKGINEQEEPNRPDHETSNPESSSSKRHSYGEVDEMDEPGKDLDEDDGFFGKSTTLPSRFGAYVATGSASIPKRPEGQNRPLRPSSIAMGVIEIDGYLFKRSGRFRRWVQRYCKVRSKKFFCYRNKGEPPVDEFRLLGHELKTPPQHEVKRLFCFQIMGRKPGMRNLTFAADNEEDFTRWKDVLSSACSIHVHKVDDISEIYVKGSGPVQTQSLAVAKEKGRSRDELDVPDVGHWKSPSEGNTPLGGNSPALKRSRSADVDAGLRGLAYDLTMSKEALDLAVPVEKVDTPKKRGWLYNSLRRPKKKKTRPPLSESFQYVSKHEKMVKKSVEDVSVVITSEKKLSNTTDEASLQSSESKELPMPVQVSEFKAKLTQSVSAEPPSTSTGIVKKPAAKSVSYPTDTRSPGPLRRLSDRWRMSRKKKKPDLQPASSTSAIISNLLFIQSNKGYSRSLTWSEHWCVLQDSYLYCYRNHGDSRPALSIPLVAGRIEECSTDGDLEKGYHLFRVIPKKGTTASGLEAKPVVLRADLESELKKWVGAIENHIMEVTLGADTKRFTDDVTLRDGESRRRSRADSLIISNSSVLTDSAVPAGVLSSGTSRRSDLSDSIDHPPDPPERPLKHALLAKLPSLPQQDDIYFDEKELSSANSQRPKVKTGSPSLVSPKKRDDADDQNDATPPYYIDQTEVEPGPLPPHVVVDLLESEDKDHPYLRVGDGEDNNEHLPDQEERKELDGGHGYEETQSGSHPAGALADSNVSLSNSENATAVWPVDPLAVADPPSGKVDCKGWLHKKTLIGTWSERYCRLIDGVLCHYKNENDMKPILSMSVSSCRVCYLTKEKGRHVFRVAPVHRSGNQLLATAKSEEMTRWVNALKRAAAKQPDIVRKSRGQTSNGGAVIVLKESPGRRKPKRSQTFNTNDNSDQGESSPNLALTRSSSVGQEKSLGDRIGKISIEKGLGTSRFRRYNPKLKVSQVSGTSSSDCDLSASSSSMAELRKSFGKGKKKLKTTDMIDKANVPASAMQDASHMGYLHQKVGVTAWVRRWCALKDLCLYVYRHANDDQPLESILLPGWEIHLTNRGARKNVMKVWHPQMKSFYFSAERSDYVQWLSCLQEAAVWSGRVGDLERLKVKPHAISSTSVSSTATASSGEGDYSSKVHETSPDQESSEKYQQVHALMVGYYKEEVETVKVNHLAVHVQLSSRHEQLRIELDDLKKQIGEVQHTVDQNAAGTSANADVEQLKIELQHLSLKIRQAGGELNEVEDEISNNKEDELRALRHLEEQHIRDLNDAGITATGSPLQSEGQVGLRTRDSPGGVTPPATRRASLGEIESNRVQHQVEVHSHKA